MRSNFYEQQLDKQGVKWEYAEKIRLDEISLTKGLRNQARLEEPLDAEMVAQYAAAKKDGVDFPPVLLHRIGKGQWIPLDGNHRLASDIKNNTKTTDAYLIETTDQMVADRIAWTWNNHVNGKRLTHEECLQHALTFVRKYGMSQKDAAREWGVNHVTLSSYVRTAEVKDILGKNDVRIPPTFTDHKVNELSPLMAMGEDVVVAAAKVVTATGLDLKNIQEMCRAAKRAKTHTEKIKAIEEYGTSEEAEVIKAATKGGKLKVAVRPSVVLLNHLRAALRVTEQHTTDVPLRPLPTEFLAAQEDVRTLVERCIRVYGLGALPNKGVG